MNKFRFIVINFFVCFSIFDLSINDGPNVMFSIVNGEKNDIGSGCLIKMRFK